MFKKSLFVFFIVFIALFALVACGEENEGGKSDKTVEIELIVDTEINVGESADIIANVLYGKSSDINWIVEDESILKVEDNKIIALKPGSTKLTAKIGSVEQSVTVTVKQGAVSIQFELNGGEVEDALPTTRDGSTEIVLPEPKKAGFSFDGWYEDANFGGEKVTKLDGTNMSITKLYAKWVEGQYELTLNLTDASGKTTTEKKIIKMSEAFTLPTPQVEGNNVFSGWYLETELVHEVKELAALSVSEKAITVYGKICNKATPYEIEFVFNGGSSTYGTKDEMVADFLVDYSAFAKKAYRTARQLGTSTTTPVNFHTFYTSTLSDGTKVSEKWGWLYKFVSDISSSKLPASNTCVSSMKALVGGTFKETDDTKKGVSVAVRAFLIGTQIGSDKLLSVDFSAAGNNIGFWKYLGASQEFKDYVGCFNSELPELKKENYTFDGWYRDEELTQGPVSNVYAAGKLYAKFGEENPVTKVNIDNKPTDVIFKYDTYQLEWTINPSYANVQGVTFTSSNPEVATVSDDGLITAISTGKTTIKMTSESYTKQADEFELEVSTPNYFDVSFDTYSYVLVGETIKLNATFKGKNSEGAKLTWLSLDNSIATVNNGVVTGVKEGYVKIRVGVEGSPESFDFGITVLNKNASDVLKFLAQSNNTKVFVRENLIIGDEGGETTYYRDIFGSVSKILMNKPLTINTQFEKAAMADKEHYGGSFGTYKESTEFITVHYTGNMSRGATAYANANYMCQTSSAVSIHYVTGNDGVYHCLDDNVVAWHAGDGTSAKFEWYPTGVMYKEGDPEWPTYDISSKGYYMLNGQETTVKVPDHPLGVKVTGKTFEYQGKTYNSFNQMGIPFTIKDGQYYIGTTWWCKQFTSAYILGSHGGNNNSVGIESAVNPESDLWLTWQMTAQLVAKLLDDFNLDITRVVGHHFYTAKSCPQPMLEHDNEIWWEFIELVRAERELRNKYADYQITLSYDADDKPSNVTSNGRVTAYVEDGSQLITYTLTVKNTKTGATETMKLGSILESKYQYCKDC